MARQQQNGGEGSHNLQAGRNLTVYQGHSLEEVREIALDVFRSNFLELRGVAEEIALGRAEKITNAFLTELQDRLPAGVQNAADPDMQRAVFNAQREYACSGEEDLEKALVDLLVDRAAHTEPSMHTIVLNEAITAAPKLPANQRRAVAVCFLVRYTRWLGPPQLDLYYDVRIRGSLVPLTPGLPKDQAAYQHIEYVGAGAIGVVPLSLSEALAKSSRGWFTRGFTRDEIRPELTHLADDERIFMPCVRDRSRLQLTAMHEDDLSQLADLGGGQQLLESFQHMLIVGAMPEHEIQEELLSRVPETAELVEVWNDSLLRLLTLTSVGIAIGHGYWRRATGSKAPLSIWIPN